MESKEAVGLAYIEFQKDFEDGEETNQWLKNVIEGLKQAERDLEVLEIIKKGFSKNFLAERLKDAYLRDDLNDEDYEKIKEWLEQ